MQSISVLDLTLRSAGRSAPVRNVASLGPYLQGVLMERIDPHVAAALHAQGGFHPYSQRCLPGAGTQPGDITWQVVALTDEAAEHIIDPLRKLETVELKHIGTTFEVAQRSLTSTPVKQLTDLIVQGGTQGGTQGGPSKQRLRIETPACFKSGGVYVFMPTVRLMFQNLLMRYFSTYEGTGEVDPGTIDYICEHVRIVSFNIHSQYFDHAAGKGKKIPAFAGTLGLSLRGPAQLVGLSRMLLAFGEYAGLGIKTSMGMGYMRCL